MKLYVKLLIFSAIALPLALIPVVTQKPTPTWHFYGASVFSTSAPHTIIRDAVRTAHDTLGGSTRQPDGSMGDPSFRIQSEQWQGKDGHERISRTMTRFNDRAGQEIAIQQVAKEGSETLIFIDHSGLKGPLSVLNALTHALEEQGVRRN